jgi:hypothetical protein
MVNPRLPAKSDTRMRDASQTATAERRGAKRVSLSVAAELVETQAGAKITGRMSDCCNFGCFVDTINTFPDRTAVRLRLHNGTELFRAEAVVAYSQLRLGMGLAFTNVSQEDRRILESWIMRGGEQQIHAMQQPAPDFETRAIRIQSKQFEKLVRLLAEKGVLKEADARDLLGSLIL